MGSIIELDQDLINKIAAGEVIERPASVVKELVENSLDANATSTIVEVKEGGKSFIRVTDNGQGMSREDAQLAIKKHTTSKIKTKEDLFNINSLGFRGEALASIAAISKMEIITKNNQDISGTKLEIENGEVKQADDIGVPQGTTVKVFDLFYNTPVRKKYLKNTEVEFRHIVDILQKYTLSHPEIGFKLIHNNNEIFNAPATTDKLGNIINIFGMDFGKELLEVKDHKLNIAETSDEISISGFIGKPSLNRADRSYISIFVNNRFVRNKILVNSIIQSYDTLLNTQRFPVAILNFSIPQNRLDVNVHPTKTIIRVENEEMVAEDVTKAIKSILESHNLVPKAKIAELKQASLDSTEPEDFNGLPETNIMKLLHKMKKSAFERAAPLPESLSETRTMKPGKCRSVDTTPSQQTQLSGEQRLDSIPSPRILGKIHKTYILVETDTGLRLVDQHAAHERVLYEELLVQHITDSIKKQNLLEPIKIEVSPEEKELMNIYKDQFKELGFNLEEFGTNTFLVRTLPTIMGIQQDKELLFDVIADLRKNLEGKKDSSAIEKQIDAWIKIMACRAAKKAGENLELMEMKTLLKELGQCKQPHCCPHGRPTMVDFSIQDLEKLFNRTRGYESNA